MLYVGVDEHTRECQAEIHVDHGPEFVCRSVRSWCEKHRVLLRYIEPGRPMQNGHIGIVQRPGFATNA